MDEKQILNTLMEWRSRLSGVAYSVLHDSHLAEDMFQNLLLKALNGNTEFPNSRSLVSWSVVTIRRACIDQLRKRKRELMVLDEDVLDLLDQQVVETRKASESSRTEALESCLASLPKKTSQVLKLRYYYGHNCQEVADKTGMSLDAIYKMISRIHHKLKQCIEVKLESQS